MKIKAVSIKHFRGIEDLPFFELNNLSILIGNNGTSKTSILEAVNFALSPSFLSGRMKHTDFFEGQEEPIEITLEFEKPFKAMLPDGFQKQSVECDKVHLKVKKRERAGNGKAFSDIVVVEHYVLPIAPRKDSRGWEIARKNGTLFQFDQRLLSFPIDTEGLPRSYYYGKNREKQIQKGFNSSISSVYDDFNWRFIKEVRKENETPTDPPTPDFFSRKKIIEDEIIQKVDEKTIEKTFNSLNRKLDNLGIENIGISFFDGNAPFDTAFLSQKIGGLEIPVAQLGSGIEMIISLLFLETLASLSKENFVVIIDEPELHLHPTLQKKFLTYLVGLSANIQVLLSTHSPYLFKNTSNNESIELLISSKETGKVIIENTGANFGLFPWSPSWGEINFQAYNLPSIEFHNELYGYLQEANKISSEDAIEAFFIDKGQTKTKKWKRLMNGQVKNPYDITLMTYIRNTIHHPDNTNNLPFTESELDNSINTMIGLLQNP